MSISKTRREEDQRAKPNILIIYPDQMRADAMGCAGNPIVCTPNIDRIAREGVRFENAYTSYPLCAPFRASFFTGKYAHSSGVYANHYPIPLDQEFLAEIFRNNYYQTGYFGKWHLNGGEIPGFVPAGERRLGFDTMIGFNRGHHYLSSIYFKDTSQPFSSNRYEPEYQTDQVISFLEACVDGSQDGPFFAMVNYGIPHPPLVGPDEYLKKYSPENIVIPTNVPGDENSNGKARTFLARYYGLITCVDDNVGRLLDWLDRKQLTESTVVIFLSDHGEMAGEHGRFAKKTYYRSAMHVPLMVRYPERFPPGNIVNSLVDPSIDTMPTLLDLCGFNIPATVQGNSYLSLLVGDRRPLREAVFYEILMERDGPENFPVPERGIRTTDWLYVRTQEKPIALFDLNSDPMEMNNLVGKNDYQETINYFDQMLVDHMLATEDNWKIEAVFPPQEYMSYEEGDRNISKLIKLATLEQ
ncbi:sulfatase [Chloroflexota bacterium]